MVKFIGVGGLLRTLDMCVMLINYTSIKTYVGQGIILIKCNIAVQIWLENNKWFLPAGQKPCSIFFPIVH
jgi:hypothetical protein